MEDRPGYLVEQALLGGNTKMSMRVFVSVMRLLVAGKRISNEKRFYELRKFYYLTKQGGSCTGDWLIRYNVTLRSPSPPPFLSATSARTSC